MVDIYDILESNCKRVIEIYEDNHKFRSIIEFGELLKKQFKDSVITILKTKNGYYARIFILKDDIKEYNKEYLLALGDLYTLMQFVKEFGDDELNYIVNKAYYSILAALSKATNEVVKSYKDAKKVYNLFLKRLFDKVEYETYNS